MIRSIVDEDMVFIKHTKNISKILGHWWLNELDSWIT
jgi:hypothetical protein